MLSCISPLICYKNFKSAVNFLVYIFCSAEDRREYLESLLRECKKEEAAPVLDDDALNHVLARRCIAFLNFYLLLPAVD
jgi:hypothetical protein